MNKGTVLCLRILQVFQLRVSLLHKKTDLPIFCKKFENQKSKSSINRYSIIYGSNGSGKTTIANALSFLSSSLKVEAIETIEKEQKEKVDVHFLNSEGKVIENERVLISNTAVFSEKIYQR